MTNDTDYRGKLRAVFLAAIMVVSVFGASVAFTGSAAAANGDVTIQSQEDITEGESSEFEQTVTVQTEVDPGASIQLGVDLTSTLDGLSGVDVPGDVDYTASSASSNGNNLQVTAVNQGTENAAAGDTSNDLAVNVTNTDGSNSQTEDIDINIEFDATQLTDISSGNSYTVSSDVDPAGTGTDGDTDSSQSFDVTLQ